MAKAKISTSKFSKNVMNVITRQLNSISSEISMDIAKAFADEAKDCLKRNATPASGYESVINEICSGIKPEMGEDGKARVTLNKKRKQALYLEYGTGIVGDNNKHPETSTIGWNYMVNGDTYHMAGDNDDSGWRKGFFFRKSEARYIDANDYENPMVFHSSIYFSKKGDTKRYVSYSPAKGWIQSQGIKPVRFIYNTKINVRNIIRESKDVKELKSKLRQIKKES